MKDGIHPEYRDVVFVDLQTGNKFVTRSTLNSREIRQGRVSSQQYLIRENGVWKIASANERSLRTFMKEHPEVERLFPQTHTRFELLSDGKWIRMPGSR